MIRVSLEFHDGRVITPNVDEKVLAMLATELKLDLPALKHAVAAVYVTGHDQATPNFRLRYHPGAVMPAWVELTFMVSPSLWCQPYCALVRPQLGVNFMDRELGYLEPRRLDDGAYLFEFVRSCLGLRTPETPCEVLTPAQVQALHTDGWRVD